MKLCVYASVQSMHTSVDTNINEQFLFYMCIELSNTIVTVFRQPWIVFFLST